MDVFVRDGREYDRTQPQRLLTDSYDSRNIPCLDLLGALRSRSEQGEDLYFPIDQHWNAAGNRRVAELIGEWLQGML
jgi:hypothetical protein